MDTTDKIQFAEQRIEELQLLINHWKIKGKSSQSLEICIINEMKTDSKKYISIK
ncbi:hypothetical protein [Prochlorococcus marinus]|uniref:hypothetical protein n=1 Tax=Prochlorococcus marinus TaxID=1219 RepID=UPI0022B38FE9|nr:hypothetical protein [Prochlorococcus marinus]